MSEIQTKEGSSSSFIRDNKGRVLFKLFSFYYILPIFYLLTATGVFLFRLDRLKLTPNNQTMFYFGIFIIFIINLSFIFYGKTIFTKRQAIKHFNYMNAIMTGLLIVLLLFWMLLLGNSYLLNDILNYSFPFFMLPLTIYSSIFFLFSSIGYFVLLFLPKKYFNISENQLHLRRNAILFYTLFFVLFYLPFILFVISDCAVLYSDTFFE